MMTLQRIDRVVALAGGALCLAVIAIGWGMRGDAGLFPIISASLGIVACLWLALTRRRDAPDERPAPLDGPRLALWCLSLLALLVLMEPLGTFVVLPLFLVFNLRWLARLRWLPAVVLAGSFSLAIYQVFARLLAVPLPAGVLAS
ncbi:tripartite tricarboxylate transporter TctB family protein [Halomonas binhaiensis]|uniref:Tripartite tricarboxylate transporter TctB family protein n=1 Tax=Halomonas binhaiensis TaxID=2562282 RepID=A0A5C1NK72_9GAMM|nr:tripartite tricarboxylate transporter TctB family protein [Halomonas binhaiensis]QEM83744.1 tripartite tricarboxylate transporter TctB family protein [Halomonas binhaiensis]